MKKSQVNQVFIYLISTLIVILVLYYGYTAVKRINEKEKELSFVQFKNAMTDTVGSVASDFGTVRIVPFVVPSGISEVCFVDKRLIQAKLQDAEDIILRNKYPIIHDSVADGVFNNVFLLPDGAPFFIEDFQMDLADTGGFSCVKVVQGRISVRLEGFGNYALLTT